MRARPAWSRGFASAMVLRTSDRIFPEDALDNAHPCRSRSPAMSGRSGATLPPEQYRLLVEHSPTLSWRAGADATCDWFSPAWLAFTGRRLDEELGDGWLSGVHPDDVESCRRARVDGFQRRRPFERTYRLRRHDGVYRTVVDNAVPFEEDGAFAGYIGSCLDIDDEQRRAEEGKSLFAMAMAHELRTPLTPLAAYIHQLDRAAATGAPLSPVLVQKLSAQVEKLSRLVEELSDGALVTSGERLHLDVDTVDLAGLVTLAVEEQRRALDRVRGSRPALELVLAVPAERVVAEVDARKLAQALRHLLSNAVKFSPRGGVLQVTLSCEPTITIVVEDEGIGVPTEDRLRLGTPFFRASNAPLANYPGVGMGFAMAKQIVRSHGGTIHVTEGKSGGRNGDGTRVIITLPSSAPTPRSKPPSSHEPSPRR